jgi:YGGT family
MSNQPYPPDPRRQNYQQSPDQPPYGNQGYVNNAARSSNYGGASEQSQYENYVDPMGNQVEQRQQVFEDKNQSRANARYWITTVTYFILGVLEIILLLRLLFRLLGANQYNGFIMFLYNLSHIFVGPFNGIFNDQALGKSGVFETSTLIAMLVYALIAWGIVSLGRVVFAPVQSGRQTTTTTRRSRY